MAVHALVEDKVDVPDALAGVDVEAGIVFGDWGWVNVVDNHLLELAGDSYLVEALAVADVVNHLALPHYN